MPFIARYRKEATGTLDEVAVEAIREGLERLRELDKRREAIRASLEERGLLGEELRAKIDGAETLGVLEDIYLPYRPKRRTRATIAREKGLEPLADLLFAQGAVDPAAEAAAFVDAEKGVATAAEALAGARDILAERISEDPAARARMRELYARSGVLRSRVTTGKEEEGAKFRDYFEWQEPAASAPSHRILAIRRGEKEGFLTLRVVVPEEEALALLCGLFVKGEGAAAQQVRLAAEDGFKRLLSLAMETESRLALKERADREAIRVFAANLRELLLAPPLGGKNVLAIDPGFRTGCKVVCLDRQGKLLDTGVVYPNFETQRAADEAAAKIRDWCERFGVEAIAIGNGTAGRETEAFVRGLGLPAAVPVVMVNESGASIYSASEIAREEFPDQDLTVRGAVSIGRRLMDPLAELVKIDPKSIGVGQYQHDVEQNALKSSLDAVVASCVNQVGVELNTASARLLSFVSGLGPSLARSIVAHRDANGPFAARADLLTGAAPRAEGLRAGRRVPAHPRGREPARRQRRAPRELPGGGAHGGGPRVRGGGPAARRRAAQAHRPGPLRRRAGRPADAHRHPRGAGAPRPRPARAVRGVLLHRRRRQDRGPRRGMKLPGIVTNVTAFGAFVDIGVHQDGLVHVSQLANRFVKDPAEVVKVQQRVQVTVLEVDLPRKRISLSMR